MTPEAMVQMWFDLLAYCQDKKSFDDGIFRLKHTEYANRYKKLRQDQQGEIAELLVLSLTQP